MRATPFLGLREAGERSESVKAYLHAAIAPSTRTAYTAAFKSWSAFCEQRSADPHGPITEALAEEWLSALADGGRVTAATIRTYKAGMSTYHTEHSTLANPFQTARVLRIITGIENDKAVREAERRRRKPKSQGFTRLHLSIVSERVLRGTPKEIMMAAAAAFMYGAALRPSEALGNRMKDPIRIDQVHFFGDRESVAPLTSLTLADGRGQPRQPHHAIIALYGSKTNQLHREENLVIVDPLAVQMVWRWYQIRQRTADELKGNPFLFALPPARAGRRFNLSGRTLLDFLREVVGERGSVPHWTPKCFRIGATSDFHPSGAKPEGLRYLGRWRTNMWQTYADTRSHVERALAARSHLL